MGSGGIDPCTLDHGTIWKWVVSFTPTERTPGTHWIWGWSQNGRPGFDSRLGQWFFRFVTEFGPTPGPIQPPIQRVKSPRLEADDSSPSSFGLRMSGAIYPVAQYAFMAWCSVKAQGQLYLYLYLLWQFSMTMTVWTRGTFMDVWNDSKEGERVLLMSVLGCCLL